jgi:hypothetical protein
MPALLPLEHTLPSVRIPVCQFSEGLLLVNHLVVQTNKWECQDVAIQSRTDSLLPRNEAQMPL